MTPEQVKLRRVREEDAERLLEIYRPYVEQTAVTFEYEVPSAEEFRSRIAAVSRRYPWLAAECGGEILGYAYASAFHPRAAYQWAAELSVYLRQDCRGRGLGRLLYEKLEKILRAQQILGMYACIAVPRGEDPYLSFASERFHAAMGFAETGRFPCIGYKFGRWYDMIWMEKRLAAPETEPQPVIPFGQLKGEQL